MSNNDDKDRWETFCKLYDKLSSKEEMRELFEEEIKCFSLYLSHVNQDYVYNATFLPQFNDDFWNFLCAFNKKYKIVEELFDAAKKYYNVTLKIGLHHFRRHIFRGCGRAGDQSGHHASSDRVADRVHPAAWPGTSKS